ncbi:PIN domain-containing protein [Desulfotignum phosphitoxidans]|uniref:PIN domain-containing protein n=1 Tax=Desulfotignum phosphitoxidans DSM 13687 TaxID=1286635 RepID=S0FPZ8_9BACT|nr:hypothetical protein [Desulfotignum phosphitoxidans]EMS77143.1 PIN domain-containing protein [Desulfotignum phosphitoxidans DSM 13687]
MDGILVDSNIILDVFLDDPNWADWSESKLLEFSSMKKLFINPIIYILYQKQAQSTSTNFGFF